MARARRAVASSALDRLRDPRVESWVDAEERAAVASLVRRWHVEEEGAGVLLYALAPTSRQHLAAGGPVTYPLPFTEERAVEVTREILASMALRRRRDAVRVEARRRGVKAWRIAQDVGVGWA